MPVVRDDSESSSVRRHLVGSSNPRQVSLGLRMKSSEDARSVAMPPKETVLLLPLLDIVCMYMCVIYVVVVYSVYNRPILPSTIVLRDLVRSEEVDEKGEVVQLGLYGSGEILN